MYNKDVLNRVIDLLSILSDVQNITADCEIMNDLDISSMEILSLICSLEEEFCIKIPEKSIRKITTVGDVVDIVSSLRK